MASGANYSRLDRALHKLSFGSEMLQEMLADIETSMFASSWQDSPAENPIFITSLPRAGTTIILEALHKLQGLATHTYRDMPFILTPVLWNKFSTRIRSQGTKRERAHGDGLIISEDSPEAFEEVLWRKFFPNNYSDCYISLWDAPDTEFSSYFREHMQKIVSLRHPGDMECRYVSKNNGNISRTNMIKTMFPDATIVIPLRDPIEHAISMWRQHSNFLKQQADDKFVSRYMEDIGHYEFGRLHRPIQFPLLDSLTAGLDPVTVDYWIAYWVATFEYLSSQEHLDFLSYENLCQFPEMGIDKLCQHIELDASAENKATAARIFKKPPEARTHQHKASPELTAQANDLYQDLLSKCLLQY